MTKKQTTEIFVNMTCPVCTSCYRRVDSMKCHFGGPYTGYTIIKDSEKPVVTIK